MEVGIDACLKSSNYDNIIVMTDGYTDWKKSRSNIQKSLITVLLFNDEDKNKVPYTAYNVIS